MHYLFLVPNLYPLFLLLFHISYPLYYILHCDCKVIMTFLTFLTLSARLTLRSHNDFFDFFDFCLRNFFLRGELGVASYRVPPGAQLIINMQSIVWDSLCIQHSILYILHCSLPYGFVYHHAGSHRDIETFDGSCHWDTHLVSSEC